MLLYRCTYYSETQCFYKQRRDEQTKLNKKFNAEDLCSVYTKSFHNHTLKIFETYQILYSTQIFTEFINFYPL